MTKTCIKKLNAAEERHQYAMQTGMCDTDMMLLMIQTGMCDADMMMLMMQTGMCHADMNV